MITILSSVLGCSYPLQVVLSFRFKIIISDMKQLLIIILAFFMCLPVLAQYNPPPGVTKIIPGTKITVSPVSGKGAVTVNASGLGGTVTSVGMTGDGVIFNSSVSGSPITTSGTLAPSLIAVTANYGLFGPTSGGALAPTYRAMVNADLPITGVTAASYGSSTSIPSFTVNAQGVLTAASGNAVIAPAGTLSGNTLNSTVVNSSLQTLGTINTGVWNGSVINALYLPTTTVESVGNLSPLFTASISAQALSFSLSNAAADTVYGNATGSSAAPGFTTNPSVTTINALNSFNLSGTAFLQYPPVSTGGYDTTGVAVGSGAAVSQTAGTLYAVALGTNALNANQSGNQNVGIGFGALSLSTTGTKNTAIGFSTLGSCSSGAQNMALGTSSLPSVTTGGSNIGIGYLACRMAKDGNNNIGIGTEALFIPTPGASDDIAIGVSCLFNCTGSQNVGIGTITLSALTSGTFNLALGYAVGSTTLTTGSNNVLIGTNSSLDTPASNTSNYIGIGAGSTAVIYATGCGTPATSITNVAGYQAINGTVTTVNGSAGSYYWSMPEQGSAYKKVIIVFSGFTDASTTTISFPTAFTYTPAVTANTTALTISTLSTTGMTIPVATLASGVLIVEGI